MNIYTLCLPYLYGMTHVSKVGSVFTTLAVSLERYFAVCRPLWIRIRRCHPAMYILLVTIFAFGFNVPKFLEFEVRFEVCTETVCLSFLKMLIVYCGMYFYISKLLFVKARRASMLRARYWGSQSAMSKWSQILFNFSRTWAN